MHAHAGVVKLAYTPALGAGSRKGVEVQVLSPAPMNKLRLMKNIVQILGWYGVVAILSAYALNVFSLTNSSGALFLWLNLTGSAGIVVVSWHKRDFQPLVLNGIWLLIAGLGLIQLLT